MKNKNWLYWLSLILIMAISFAIRFNALNKYTVLSADYGNYLTQASILRGYDATGVGLRYNPLFFAFLNVFLIFFDEFTALKVLASFVFSVAGVPFFILAKKLCHNYSASLVSTWTFLFFEGYSEMIAWGGNPNFLGFSFMLLTLFFLVDSFKEPSIKNILLTGFSLSLVIGTHVLVAVFTFLFFFVFASLTLAFNRKSLRKSVRILLSTSGVAAGFSLPYVPFYVTFVENFSTSLVEFNFLKEVNTALVVLAWLFRSSYLIVVIMVALGIFALSTYVNENRNNALILCSLFVLPFILSLITENPDRWFYFLPIPIMLSFALYLGSLFEAIRNKRKEILVLVFYFILLVSIGSTVLAVNRLEVAVDYYQAIGDNELQALRWIKDNTSSNVTFATSGPNKAMGGDTMPGSSYSWWIEGFAQRKSLHTGLTVWYTYKDERLETEMTNRFFAGTYVFEHGNTRISDAFPAGLGNPEIATYINGQYQNLLFLNDGEEEITFSPVENEQIVWHEVPFYAVSKTTDIYCNENWANATFSYDWSRLNFTRSVIMDSKQSSVDVIFRLLPVNSTLKQFTLNVWGAFYTSLESFNIENSTVTLQQRLETNDLVKTRITMLDTNGELNSTQVFFKDPKYSMPCVTYRFTPVEHDLFLHMRISVDSATTEQADQRIDFYNSYNLIKDLGINYIFLNKARFEEYHRFSVDSEHYAIVFQNESIAIFKVL